MKKRILVIDDQQDIADSLARLLTMLGYEARAIYNGELAEGVVADFLPDLSFIDISMPGFDGYQTVTKIRANRECIHLVLIALTGYSSKEFKQRAYEAGFDLFVAKPMSVDTLKEVLSIIDPNVSKLPAREVARELAKVWSGKVA
jgi:CheY-like chemotaxis protein